MKSELIKIGEALNAKEVMSSLEIAELTGKRHSDVMRDIRNIIEQIGNETERNFALSEYRDSTRRKLPMYILDKKGSLCLASGYDAKLRMTIINRWEELELEKRSHIIELPDFTNPAEAAIAWAEQYKAKEAALLEAQKQKEHVERLTHDAKTYTTSEIAKELNIKSANQLNNILADHKVQYKLNNTWLLYSNYADKEYVSIKQTTLDSGKIIYDRRWTGKGRDFIINLIKDNND